MGRRIVIGSDHAGFSLKEQVEAYLQEQGHEVSDLGTHDEQSTDYPDYGHAVAKAVASGEAELGVLVCGTGVGMSMTANRNRGVRAVVCSEPYSAKMARLHNDANVLCFGARVVGFGLACAIVDAFFGAEFEGGRHQRRVGKIDPTEPTS